MKRGNDVLGSELNDEIDIHRGAWIAVRTHG